MVVSGGVDRTFSVLSFTETGEQLRVLPPVPQEHTVTLAQDARFLLSWLDNKIKIWQVDDVEPAKADEEDQIRKRYLVEMELNVRMLSSLFGLTIGRREHLRSHNYIHRRLPGRSHLISCQIIQFNGGFSYFQISRGRIRSLPSWGSISYFQPRWRHNYPRYPRFRSPNSSFSRRSRSNNTIPLSRKGQLHQ